MSWHASRHAYLFPRTLRMLGGSPLNHICVLTTEKRRMVHLGTTKVCSRTNGNTSLRQNCRKEIFWKEGEWHKVESKRCLLAQLPSWQLSGDFGKCQTFDYSSADSCESTRPFGVALLTWLPEVEERLEARGGRRSSQGRPCSTFWTVPRWKHMAASVICVVPSKRSRFRLRSPAACPHSRSGCSAVL